jgi:hypothetical protein
VLAGLVRAHGKLFVAATSGLFVLRLRDGAVLHKNLVPNTKLWSMPLVDRYRVVVGTVSGEIRAYRVPR